MTETKNEDSMIKVLGLIHKRSKQSDPRLAWFMFHNIYCVYSDVNKKEERSSDVLLTIMSEHEKANK